MHSEPHDHAWTERPATRSSFENDRIDGDRMESAPGLTPSLTATAPGRLKVIKRAMYGRAGFDLLRHRVLAAA